MKLYLQDKNANELDLTGYNPNWTISPTSIDVRQSVIDRYKQYGSTIISDNYFGARKISLTFNLAQKPVTSIANTDLLYTTKLNEIAYFLRNDASPFYILDKQDTLNIRRLKVSAGAITESFNTGLEKRFGQYTINFMALDSLWEETEQTITNANYAVDRYVDVTLPIYCFPSYFQISFLSDSVLTTTIQETNSGRYLTINTSSFPVSSAVVVDSRTTGSLTINGTQYNQFILNGGFFPLQTGTNRIRIYINYSTATYLSTAPTIVYRPRFPY